MAAPRNAFKPVSPVTKNPSTFPAHKIASQFGAVHPAKPEEEGYAAQRDMYEVTRSQDVMQQNPFGITHSKQK